MENVTAILILFSIGTVLSGVAGRDRYSNSWAVEVRGGVEKAEELARHHGFVNLGQVGNLANIYHFMLAESTQPNLSKRAIYSLSVVGEKPEKTTALMEEEDVGYVKQQKLHHHVKKGNAVYTPPSTSTDPYWNKQWSLENLGQTCGPSGLDLNVEPVWMQGITGRGVLVAVVDDGLEISHPDLAVNYNSTASYDFVNYDNNPTPDFNPTEPNSHGTSCAGEVGMAKGNGYCGVGVAYECSIGSVKVIGNEMDVTEAQALSYQDDTVSVYSNSWGPSDNGYVVEGPGVLVQQTLSQAVVKGRGGKGNIYVWAAGNGGLNFDSCAADGYVSSIYTIAVGSADQNARQADYDEQCASKMAVTFSYNSDTFPNTSKQKPYNQVSTTTLDGKCTDEFTGTSASAPLLSGVIALVLQANPDLTWRDVQYLIAYTSNSDILHNGEWTTNGAGLPVSHKFGFGAIDAEAMVTRARRWTNVPEQLSYQKNFTNSQRSASKSSPTTTMFNLLQSDFSHGSPVMSFLEHVVVTVTLTVQGYSKGYDYNTIYKYYTHISKDDQESLDFYYEDNDLKEDKKDVNDWLANPHPRRGDIMLELTSPQNTTSVLLPFRKYDFVNKEGYYEWPFMSVHYWGENPIGAWTLKVSFKSDSGYVNITNLSVTFYGTATIPALGTIASSPCDTSCARGCSGTGQDSCDVCKSYRIAETLECVDQCPNDMCQYHKYCLRQSYGDCPKDGSLPPKDCPIKSKKSLYIGLGVAVPCALLFLAVVVSACMYYRYTRHRRMQFQPIPLAEPTDV